MNDPINTIIVKYSNHPSINNINKNINRSNLYYTEVQLIDIEEELGSLDSIKACMSNSISPKLLKENSCVCSVPLKGFYQ